MANETNTGWVRLYRSTLNWEWFDDPLTLQLWIVCLLKANHAPTRWQGIDIERGSFVSSVEKLCAATGQSARQIRTRLSNLQKSQELTIETTNRFSIITVCKYDIYQPIIDESDEQNDNQPTNDRQANDKQTTTNNNNKELNNNKESFSSRACATEAERETFYEIFFFKNFLNPEYEVERFCANYEASGWVRKNGQPVIDRLALARTWTQEDSKTAPRFPVDFLKKWRILYNDAKSKDPAAAWLIIHGLRGVAIYPGSLTLICSPKLGGLIDQHWQSYFVRFFNKFYNGLSINKRTM